MMGEETWYSASRLSARASLRASACFVAASLFVSEATRSTLAFALPFNRIAGEHRVAA